MGANCKAHSSLERSNSSHRQLRRPDNLEMPARGGSQQLTTFGSILPPTGAVCSIPLVQSSPLAGTSRAQISVVATTTFVPWHSLVTIFVLFPPPRLLQPLLLVGSGVALRLML